MRLSAQEKQEIIHLVDRSDLGVNRTLKELGIHKSTFYKWYKVYQAKGLLGLQPQKRTRQQWNSIPEEQKQLVVEVALDNPILSPRELSVKITDEHSRTNKMSMFCSMLCFKLFSEVVRSACICFFSFYYGD